MASTQNHALDEMASGVDPKAVGEMPTDAERRLSTVRRAIDFLKGTNEKMALVERALSVSLPDCLREVPMGAAIDLIAELDKEYRTLSGDGGTAKAVGKRIDFCKEVTMPERMDAEEVKTFNTAKFGVTTTSKVMVSFNPEAGMIADTANEYPGMPEGYKWLDGNGHGSLIKYTVNASSLSALGKSLMEGGHELPEDLFRIHTKRGLSIRKK